jgi:hypothetical protein
MRREEKQIKKLEDAVQRLPSSSPEIQLKNLALNCYRLGLEDGRHSLCAALNEGVFEEDTTALNNLYSVYQLNEALKEYPLSDMSPSHEKLLRLDTEVDQVETIDSEKWTLKMLASVAYKIGFVFVTQSFNQIGEFKGKDLLTKAELEKVKNGLPNFMENPGYDAEYLDKLLQNFTPS